MRIYILMLLVFYSISSLATDISVEKVELWYLDNITDPKKPIVRKLSSLHEDKYWSKPEYVDVEVIVKNNGTKIVKYTSLSLELYHLLSHRNEHPSYTALPNELKTITSKPTWVWTKNLVNGMTKGLKPGESKSIIYKNQKVKSNYYPTDYSFNAFAVKVFANPRGNDKNYNNNSNYKIVSYGD